MYIKKETHLYFMRGKFLDLVVAGPDMSGTSTQINDIIKYFGEKNLNVRDIRGTEIDVLFHTEEFSKLNRHYKNFSEFPKNMKDNFLTRAHELLSRSGTNQDLRVASMVRNNITTYVDPNSADVWVMEEPPKRGAGQINRVIEQNRSQFGDVMNPLAAALAHQAYRSDEFLRFRKPLRDNKKIIVRSRSEESACYQIYDKSFLPNGIKMNDYLKLPGHQVAFRNSPTNIFVVCGSDNWTDKDYLKLKAQRGNNRYIDDYEARAWYQVMVNNRYASNWIENLYDKGCKMHNGITPEITRFSIYDSETEIREKMSSKLESIL